MSFNNLSFDMNPTGYNPLLMPDFTPQHSFMQQLELCSGPSIPEHDSTITQMKREITELQQMVMRLQTEKHDNNCKQQSVSFTEDQKPILLIGEAEYDRKLNLQDYPLVQSWMKKDWLVQTPKIMSAKPGSSSKSNSQGSAWMAQGVNVSCTYLQDENGQAASAQSIKLLTDNYHIVKKTCCSTSVKPEDTTPDDINMTPQTHESPIEIPDRTASMTSGLPDSLSPLSINSVSEIPCIESRDQENEVKKQLDSPCGSDVPQHMLLCSTNKGKAKERANIEIKNSLPSRMPLSVADVASLGVKMELVATENTVMKTMNTISNSQPVKKHQPNLKPMRVGLKITPCNICALDWQKNSHQREPHEEGSFFFNTAGLQWGDAINVDE
ncbi:hypothetical protein EDB19DRAFT_1834989 [Suillus lakei]|nr:hypothetical protein EDB19DRAFT_1834989 [Suillus lakei]